MPDTFSGGILLTVIAMATVFTVLAGLALVIYLSRLLARGGDVHPCGKVPAAQVYVGPPADTGPASSGQQDTEEAGTMGIPPQVVAAITAALSVYLEKPVDLGQRVPAPAAGSWVIAGRQAQFKSRRTGTR
ncbi:MAG: OadG family protein [Bacillota bacterium]